MGHSKWLPLFTICVFLYPKKKAKKPNTALMRRHAVCYLYGQQWGDYICYVTYTQNTFLHIGKIIERFARSALTGI